MSDRTDGTREATDFAGRYATLLRPAIAEIAEREVAGGADALAEARAYAERGKPEFVLAYLLAANIPEADRREVFALAHERRARNTEERAVAFDRQFRRPFPLLRDDAARDRTAARQIRAGRAITQGRGRALPAG